MQQTLWDWLGISPLGAGAIALGTAVMYLVFVGLMRVAWPHLAGARSAFSLALITVMGAVVGRTMLGPAPTLAAGLIVVATLVAMEAVVGMARRWRRLESLGRASATVVLADGVFDQQALRRTYLSERDVLIGLRRRGVLHLEDVTAVILEANGALTVIHAGTRIDPQLLAGVRGAEKLTAR